MVKTHLTTELGNKKAVKSSLLSTGGQRLTGVCLRENGRNPHIYGQLTFKKHAMNTQWGKDSLFNNWISTGRRMKLDPYLIPYTKINSKWIKDLHVRPETVKLLEKNLRGRLLDIALGNNFLVLTPKSQATKAKTNKWNYIKLSFCTE